MYQKMNMNTKMKLIIIILEATVKRYEERMNKYQRYCEQKVEKVLNNFELCKQF